MPFYFSGLILIPMATKNIYRRLPIQKEYQLVIGAFTWLGISYQTGIYFRSRCAERVRRELPEYMI